LVHSWSKEKIIHHLWAKTDPFHPLICHMQDEIFDDIFNRVEEKIKQIGLGEDILCRESIVAKEFLA